MPQRLARMRTARGLALAILGLALLGSAGCRWLPARRPAGSIDPRRVSISEPASDSSAAVPPLAQAAGSAESVPLPALPLTPVSDAEALAMRPPAPTPALDAALARAEAIQESMAAELEPPEAPAPRPPAPLPDPAPELLAADRPSAEPPRDEALMRAAVPPAELGAPSPPDRAEAPKLEPIPEPPPEPEDAWRAALDHLLKLARVQAEAEPTPGLWSARREVLSRLSEADADTARDALWQAVLTTLAVSASDPEPEPQPEPEPTLQIAAMELCKRVDGFGLYEPAEPGSARVGRPITLYWEIEGLQSVAEGDLHKTRLAARIELLPTGSDEPAWSFEKTAEDACRRPRRDYFVNVRLPLPATLAPGDYRLRLILEDRIAGRSASRELPLSVAP